eukprot:gene12115-12254_t
MDTFADRRHAGKALGAELCKQLSEDDSRNAVVFGLVRGGLPVAEPVALALNAPLDAFVSRKLGAPHQPEFGIGAIAEGGQYVVNEGAADAVGATVVELEHILQTERQELVRRVTVYRQGQDHLPVSGKIVVLVDDGLATGVTARAALKALRAKGAAKLVLAVPVGSARTVSELTATGQADAVVCLMTPWRFRAVGQWYDDFRQTTDEEVVEILARHRQRQGHATAMATAASQVHKVQPPQNTLDALGTAPSGRADASMPSNDLQGFEAAAAHVRDVLTASTAATTSAGHAQAGMRPTPGPEDVVITGSSTDVQLLGTLTVPEGAEGLVVFAHGSGSSRNSPRNKKVAATLNDAGLATLLFDLLLPREAEMRSNVFDICLLANRLQLAVEWLVASHRLPDSFPLGFFGASTGGGACLVAAAQLGPRVSAVVVRGGRPDLAAEVLPRVSAPTLLLVGGADLHVLGLNQVALSILGSAAVSRLAVVPGAGHLFEGPGQLGEVADQAVQWFKQHMAPQA